MECDILGCNEEAVIIRKPLMWSNCYCQRHFDEIYYGFETKANGELNKILNTSNVPYKDLVVDEGNEKISIDNLGCGSCNCTHCGGTLIHEENISKEWINLVEVNQEFQEWLENVHSNYVNKDNARFAITRKDNVFIIYKQ